MVLLRALTVVGFVVCCSSATLPFDVCVFVFNDAADVGISIL